MARAWGAVCMWKEGFKMRAERWVRQSVPREGKNVGAAIANDFVWKKLREQSESDNVSHQSSLTLCNPMDCSPPGSFVHGILQASG